MKKIMILSLFGLFIINNVFSQKQPEFYGKYIVENDSLIELPPFEIKLQNMQVGNQNIPVFTSLPQNINVINTITPTIIYYDQSVSTSTVRFSYIYKIQKSEELLAYSPLGTIPLKIKPLDKPGMFLFKPEKPLATGLYAIYGGEVLGYQGASSGNIGIIRVTHPRENEIYNTIIDFINALEIKDYASIAKLSYAFVNKKDYIPNNEETAKKFKKSKIFSGKIIPASIIEMKDADGTIFYKVYVISIGALISIQVGNLINLGDSYGNFMYVCDKADGNLRVFTKPEDGGWMFINK
jgi:hypothetical protein